MGSTGRLIFALAGLATITGSGVLGYMLIEGVGYKEVTELSDAGRIFTIGLIIVGVGLGLYLLGTLAELVVEGRVRDVLERRAMQKQIDQLENLVIVESDTLKEPDLIRTKAPYVIGSALSDEVLEQAGVRRASAIVIATSSEADNVFITLSARKLNPKIRVLARGESATVKRRLQLAGKSIEALEQETSRLRIVALKRAEDPIRIIPEGNMHVEGADHLVVIGEHSSLEALAQQAQATS
jgi:voltage-gated potassium channel